MSAPNPCQRAAFLRDEAESLPAPLAVAYKRRASELELEAHLRSVHQGSVAVAA